MNEVNSREPLLPSVLDRLLDDEPDVSTEPAWKQSQTLRELKLSVRRDLEALLNTRQTSWNLSPEFQQMAKSVLTYGLPDFTAASPSDPDQRERFRIAVQQSIARFEPRLRNVRVTLHDPREKFDRTLRLTIDAVLWVQPNPEPVTFDTVVKAYTADCQVEARE